MKKTVVLLLTLLLAAALLTACGCEHEWQEADCNDPKTCTKCGATEGEELGHDYQEANCENPKTCSLCGKTRGEALGHEWTEADCDDPAVCTRCNATGEAAKGHTWADATCETPKTCAECGLTEGEALGHVFPEFTDCENPPVCGVCGAASQEAKPHTWTDATCETPKTCIVCSMTEGEPLGHTWLDATLEAPKTCSVCGLTEGEPLTPAYGLGMDQQTLHSAIEARVIEVGYTYASEFYGTSEDGADIYAVYDTTTGYYTDIYLFYYLCDDGVTVDSFYVYTPFGGDEGISNLCGVYLGSAIYAVDQENGMAALTDLLQNPTVSDDGKTVTYYTELGDYAYMMLVEDLGDGVVDLTCAMAGLQ